LVEWSGRRAEENNCLIGSNLHPKVKSPTVRLTDDGKLWSPFNAKTPTVDGTVRTNRKGQLAS
jgi:hypothetical protein